MLLYGIGTTVCQALVNRIMKYVRVNIHKFETRERKGDSSAGYKITSL
jgi:hypothetical protein